MINIITILNLITFTEKLCFVKDNNIDKCVLISCTNCPFNTESNSFNSLGNRQTEYLNKKYGD